MTEDQFYDIMRSLGMINDSIRAFHKQTVSAHNNVVKANLNTLSAQLDFAKAYNDKLDAIE